MDDKAIKFFKTSAGASIDIAVAAAKVEWSAQDNQVTEIQLAREDILAAAALIRKAIRLVFPDK